jgi:protein-S-isoprenylcysteine O-methyltransferase Ste14
MSRQNAALASALFFLLAPGTVAGLLPWGITRWSVQPMPAAYLPLRIIGVILLVAGLGLILESFARFVIEGRGTPAPPMPTERLVVRGAYRFVRNPMYVAVLVMILGQVLLFASLPLLLYAVVVALAFHLFVVLYEEPALARAHGVEYDAYRAAVPRWIPRFAVRHRTG